jgi:hypothetical protein
MNMRNNLKIKATSGIEFTTVSSGCETLIIAVFRIQTVGAVVPDPDLSINKHNFFLKRLIWYSFVTSS